MHWFTILLLVVFAGSVLLNLVDVARGERLKEVRPLASSIAAILNLLVIWGIFTYL